MWFLILQIFGLMLLAAALGAGLAYWWLIGRHEDVTETFASLKGRSGNSREDGELKELQLELIGIGAKLDSLENADLTPLASGLSDVKTTLPSLQADILGRLERLDSRVSDTRDALLPLMDGVETLRTKTSNTDDALPPLVAQLRTIEEMVAPLEARLLGLERALEIRDDGPGEVDLSPVMAHLAEINTRLDSLGDAAEGPKQILGEVQQRLVGLGEQFGAAHAQIEGFESQLSAINPTIDLSSIHARIEHLQGELSPLAKQLSGLDETLQAVRNVDMTSMVNTVHGIEARLDVEGIENRLTSIEYGLAATHHMLRSRLAQAGQAPDIPRREPFRSGPPTEPVFAAPEMAARPVKGLDPLDVIRHPDGRADLLLEAGFGAADELEQIHGIGPEIRKALNGIGVFYFWQMAGWSDADQAWIDSKLPRFRGQITRDSWVSQARTLSREPHAAERPRAFGDEL